MVRFLVRGELYGHGVRVLLSNQIAIIAFRDELSLHLVVIQDATRELDNLTVVGHCVGEFSA